MSNERFESIDLIFLDGFVRDHQANTDIADENAVIKLMNRLDDKIDELEEKYEFGQKYGFCKMHNIKFAINILTELKEELKE